MTATIRILDEFNTLHVRHTFPADMTFAEAIMQTYPEGFPGQTCLIKDPDWNDVFTREACDVPMGDGEWTLALRPQEPATITAFLLTEIIAGVTVLQLAVTAVALLGAFLLKPELPQITNGYNWDDSDQPQFFSAQSNRLRPGSRVPDVFGVMRVWPDLIAEPWTRYAGDAQTISELYVVTNGLGDIDPAQARFSEEPISTIPASQITVYNPGDAWPTDFPIYKTNTFVGGTEMPGPNEDAALVTTFTFATAGTITASTAGFFTQFVATVGSTFMFSDPENQLNQANRRVYTVQTVDPSGDFITVTPPPGANQTDVGQLNFRGVDQFVEGLNITEWRSEAVGGLFTARGTVPAPVGNRSTGSIVMTANNAELDTVTHQQWTINITPPQDPGESPTYTYFTGYGWQGSMLPAGTWTGAAQFVTFTDNSGYNPEVPGSGLATSIFRVPGFPDRIEFDVEFTQGLYQQAAGETPVARTVDVVVYYRTVGTVGWPNAQSFSFTAKTRTPRRFTEGLDLAGQDGTVQWEVYFERTTPKEDDTATNVYVDAVRLIGLRGRQVLPTDVTSDVLSCTLVRLDLSTQNGQQVTDQRRFNCVVQRQLPNRRPSGDGSLRPTNNIVDAMLYTLIDEGGYDPANIDIAALEAIEVDLFDLEGPSEQFHAIMDQTVSTEDQLQMIANVGRIIIYRRGSQIYFNRMKAGIPPRMLYNARNKVEPEKKTFQYGDQNKPTSVILRYLDANDDWKEKTVQWPDPASVPGADLSPEEQSVLGITSPVTAQRVAQYLWDKRTYERDTIEVTVGPDGILVGPGDVVAITDHLTVEAPLDGEVLTRAGTVYTFDDNIPSGEYRALLRDNFGRLIGDGFITLGNAEPLNVRDMATAGWPSDPTLPDPQTQTSFLYSFIPVTTDDAAMYQVLTVAPTREGVVTLSGIQYRDDAYQSDVATMAVTPARKQRMI